MATKPQQSQNWWAQVLRGVVAILFGIAALAWPGFAASALRLLVLAFGIYALADGILAFVSMVRGTRQGTSWWSNLVEGVVGIVVGLLVLFWPGATALLILYLIVAWAVVSGVFKVISAFPSRDWLLMSSGGVLVLLGLVLFGIQGSGVVVFLQVIGAFAIVFGFLMLVNGLEMRTQPQRPAV
jgi:uncharacterized membrane protein HdeD (DUF308 family)